METTEKPLIKLIICGNFVQKSVEIVETVALHFKETAHFEAGIVCNNIIHLFLCFFKVFASMLTFFFAGKPYKIRTFAEVVYVKFLVIPTTESKDFLPSISKISPRIS